MLYSQNQSNIASPTLVTALAKRLDKGISIDNGVMHMMSLADIPMIVLLVQLIRKNLHQK